MLLATCGDYEVSGLREADNYIEGGFDEHTAHFFGVYKRLPADDQGDRLVMHLADFNSYADAKEYINFKGE